MGALKALLEDLAEQRTYRFEEPWRFSSRALGLAVPIVRTSYGERAYLLLDEIPGGVDIRDSGEIRRLIAKSGVDKPVFIRGGLIVRGETQPRTIRFGVIIMPGEEKPIEALCVHDVRPIRASARMRPARDVPARLLESVIEGDQARVWSRIRARAAAVARARRGPSMEEIVRELAMMHAGLAMSYCLALPEIETDLVRVEEELERAIRDIREVIERFPLIKDQVGVAILDARGVYAMELFDHPDSWSTVAKNAGRKFAEVLAEESEHEIFKPDKEGIMEAIRAFLSKLGESEEKVVFKSKTAYTSILRGDGVCGEYTVLDESVIHLMAVRAEEHRFEFEAPFPDIRFEVFEVEAPRGGRPERSGRRARRGIISFFRRVLRRGSTP